MQTTKFIIKEVQADKNQWLEMQKNALDYLQKQNNPKIDQSVIIEFAKRYFLNSEISRIFQEFSSDFSKIYFNPIVSDVEVDMNQAKATFKFYYFDDLNVIDINKKVNVHFRNDLENDPSVKPFIDEYVKSYDFKIPVQRPSQEGDIVTFELQNIENSHSEINTLQIDSTKDQEIAQLLLNKELNKEYSVSFKNKDYILKLIQIKEVKKQPINDKTIHLLGIDEIHTVEEAKNFIMKTVVEQLFYRELAQYKEKVYEELINQIELPEPPTEIVNKELENIPAKIKEQAANDPQFNGNVEEVIKQNQEKFLKYSNHNFKLAFLNSYIPRTLKLDITKKEVDEEYKLIYSMIPVNERQKANISVPNVVQVLLNRKIGLYFLKMNEPEIYEKYSK
ncbi:hypothetical protein C4M97_03065 [Mycoplasmopsis pullorum]|uniref:trigger factor-related chaperone n=1 Tax=Mycoplasmopsis pullorum TaxID=48003 RepID=UPI00111BB9B3|nr:hypothetical protein [Mycoplasmopsis pullorum]TNK82460.1 hypothetical protein C4M94_00790 [Mycoplasmopsis pullorum]TNK83060.1 hypothetical protein C4M80_01505 [Mycoplasmopsis pullorum]TNK84599.1 hypothetical protein C4M81_01785 [Mycoplasmopsis pullorum]TNK85515.1 hypothetical protein C4M92_01105 [Mycoplasmopsis pullorum]TNK85897.1 hypothetical protein C4M85_02085 [Mycoplasmopsis pullorum]